MSHFDDGGRCDTSLDLKPLHELLSHPLVEMGPAAVRVQAALEAAVYATAMTPLDVYERKCFNSEVSSRTPSSACLHTAGNSKQ
jgi:hypothetical protein